MPRIRIWLIIGGVLAGWQAGVLLAAGPVASWQVKGTLAALNDKHAEVREKAAKKFAELLTAGEKGGWKDEAREIAHGERAKELFVKLMNNKDEEPAVRVAPADVVVKLKDTQVIPVLIELCKHKDPSLRRAAATLLVTQKDAQVIPALLILFRDTDPSVRTLASAALEKRLDTQLQPGLIEALKDKEPLASCSSDYECCEVRGTTEEVAVAGSGSGDGYERPAVRPDTAQVCEKAVISSSPSTVM